MERRFINQFGERETVDQVFLAGEKQLRANRNGNLYLQIRLSDRTGSLTAMMWNASDQVYQKFENGDYLKVQGATQHYNGSMQMIVNRFDKVEASTVNESDFVTLASAEVDQYASRLSEMLRSVNDPALRNLVECFLMDEDFMSKFSRAPAGVKNHHAYHGGLLEHVVSLMELAALTAPRYSKLNRDIMLLGAFLHDMGKIQELTYDRDLGYSDEGQMIGHLVIGVSILDEKIREAEKLSSEPFPAELAMQLKHIIVSHHGSHEFGSPKVPMTLEAVALHYLDNLDAKMHSFGQLIDDDPNTSSNWTPYQANIGRKIYKGTPPAKTSEED